MSACNLSADFDKVNNVACRFGVVATGASVLGEGNINTTYLVSTAGGGAFILQRISEAVFPVPQQVAENSLLVAEWLCENPMLEDIVVPKVLRADNGMAFVEDEAGGIWRAQQYLSQTVVYDHIETSWQARELGRCLAIFHNAVASFQGKKLGQVLPGFHDLKGYLAAYDRVMAQNDAGNDDERACVSIIAATREQALELERLQQRKNIGQSIIHGDPKLSNVLFVRGERRAMAMIDLDTVGLGYRLHDIGDMLRSVACSGGEEDRADTITCDMASLEQAMRGYLSAGKLTHGEQEGLYWALFAITFELGVRFFTDHLEGNRYFKVETPGHNLRRAMVQFQLVRGISRNRETIEDIFSSIQQKRNEE